MTRLAIQLTITLNTALSVGAGGSAGTLADKSIVRDGWGRPLIPGSQVKGKLRWAVEQVLRGMGDAVPSPFEEPPNIPMRLAAHAPLHRSELAHALFGSPQHRSPLHFADLPLTLVSAAQANDMREHLSQVRPSVSINRRRGTAEDARLLFQEVTLEGMPFFAENAITGNLALLAGDATQYAALLWAALKLTDRWGGAKSRGLGWATIEAVVALDGKTLNDELLAEGLRAALLQKGDSA